MDGQRIAVVTGAGSGIGAAVSLELANSGWLVVLAGRRRERLADTAAAGDPESFDIAPVDVTDEQSVTSLFDQVVARHGRVDLLFNNAGVFAPGHEFDRIPLSEWNEAVSVNLTGAFLCAREAFRVMRGQSPQGGRIVNNGSISATTPRPQVAAYTATKHAISGLTKQIALDGREFGIACSQIDIGNAATQLSSSFSTGTRQADGSLRPEPQMRVEDVGRAVAYMAGLPLDTNVLSMTIMATNMPFVGRG